MVNSVPLPRLWPIVKQRCIYRVNLCCQSRYYYISNIDAMQIGMLLDGAEASPSSLYHGVGTPDIRIEGTKPRRPTILHIWKMICENISGGICSTAILTLSGPGVLLRLPLPMADIIWCWTVSGTRNVWVVNLRLLCSAGCSDSVKAVNASGFTGWQRCGLAFDERLTALFITLIWCHRFPLLSSSPSCVRIYVDILPKLPFHPFASRRPRLSRSGSEAFCQHFLRLAIISSLAVHPGLKWPGISGQKTIHGSIIVNTKVLVALSAWPQVWAWRRRVVQLGNLLMYFSLIHVLMLSISSTDSEILNSYDVHWTERFAFSGAGSDRSVRSRTFRMGATFYLFQQRHTLVHLVLLKHVGEVGGWVVNPWVADKFWRIGPLLLFVTS